MASAPFLRLPCGGLFALCLALPACAALPRLPPPGPAPSAALPDVAGVPPPVPQAGPSAQPSVGPDTAWPPRLSWENSAADNAGVVWDVARADLEAALGDARSFLSWEGLAELGLVVGGAAALANSDADRRIRHWYQLDVRSPATDAVGSVVRYSSEYWVVVPLFLGAALAPSIADDPATDAAVHAWAHRSIRATAVGGAAMLALQAAVGGTRPAAGDSRWRPLHDLNGVSGHAFIGAVPWLTAAHLADDRWCRAALVAAAAVPSWARVNKDRHYFSQVLLGWSLAYLGAAAVHESETGERWFRLLPSWEPDGPGVALRVDY